MLLATSLERSLAQRSASTINKNRDSAGEEISSRGMARTAVDIDSLSATLEAIYSVLGKKGDFRNHSRRKTLKARAWAQGRFDYSFFALNKKVRDPRR